MAETSRRQFLKTTGASAVAAAALPWDNLSAAGTPTGTAPIPAHRAIAVPGVHAYADVPSVVAGQTIAFHVSSSAPYRLSICRLGAALDDPAGDSVLHVFPESPARVQPIHPGSYIHVEKGLTRPPSALTLECWLRPWKMKAPGGVLTQFDAGGNTGFGLFAQPDGSVRFVLGNAEDRGNTHAGPAETLKLQHWHHVAAAWDGREKSLWIDGLNAGRWPWTGPLPGLSSPLRIGAGGGRGGADDFLDADVAMPAIHDHALAPARVRERFQQRGRRPAAGKGVLACWPLAEETGDRLADVSGNGRHGRLINHGTWMIGGPGFDADVPRYGNYDPAGDPLRGHGLRLASDDLYDCRWEATQVFRVPPGARPGIYAGRIEFESEGRPRQYHVTFIVRRPKRRRPAPILVLCATNTWRAYSATSFGRNLPERKQAWGTNGIANSPGDPPAYCFYRGHAAGQGTFQIGLRTPWPAAGPYVLYGGRTDYSHLCRADRCFHVWLERSGYEFDVATDLDLHRNPELPQRYRVFVINGHNEYWSLPMYRGLETHLARGGNVLCLSGNTLFWRVSFSADGSILECRKVDAPGDQMPHERRGECWHSHDGLRGGLLRECGYPGWRLVGLETLGWNNHDNPAQFGPYLVDAPDHFLFQRPEPVGVARGEALGQGTGGGLPRANGHEIDVRLSTLASLQEQSAPAGATLPADPPGMTRLANGVIPWKIGGAAFDYFFRPVKPATDQGGEMIYWERPGGGRVFNSGSIGTSWALLEDPRLQTLVRNVLHHFGVTPGGARG